MKLALALTLMTVLSAQTVQVLLKDGKRVEGTTKSINIQAGGRNIPLRSLLSLHNGTPAEGEEAKRIDGLLAQLNPAAVDELTAIGLPVLTPLLASYKDTDQHEPRPLYRLFARIMPDGLDQLERTDSMLRLSNGEAFRAKVGDFTINVAGQALPWSNIRRLAVRQARVEKNADLQALQHCTQIEYLDSGIEVAADSNLIVSAKGIVRNAFNQDGWASDADGLKVPGPNYKTNLVDGHPFGAVVARTGNGDVQRIGKNFSGKAIGTGRFRLAVNDNRHWQNNVGAFRVRIVATNAYDLGDPR